jgi:hypothetical protein
MKLDHCLVLSLIEIADHRDGVLANRVAGSVNAGNEDEAGNALTLCDHVRLPLASSNIGRIGTKKEHSAFVDLEVAMFFTFPEDASWNANRQAVEFGIEIGEYAGTVRVGRRVFQHLLSEAPTPDKCV